MLDLCKGTGELLLGEMSKLYVEELAVAGAAAKGDHKWALGEGAHVGVKREVADPVAPQASKRQKNN